MQKPKNEQVLVRDIVELLKQNQIISIGTETVYALLGNACESAVIQAIYTLKQRPKTKPMAIFLGDIGQLKDFAYEIPNGLLPFLKQWMPGPITLLLPSKPSKLSPLLTQQSYLGIRIPRSKLLLQVLHKIDFPLIATSANPSNQPPATSAKQVRAYFPKQVLPYLWDSGKTELKTPSTVISFENKLCKIHRLGAINISDLAKMLPKDFSIVTT